MTYDQILQMCAAVGTDRAVSPSDVARELSPFGWQSLLKRVRAAAVKQAKAGYVEILRKGKPVDPDDFKGVYKITLVDGININEILNDPELNKGSGSGLPTPELPE